MPPPVNRDRTAKPDVSAFATHVAPASKGYAGPARSRLRLLLQGLLDPGPRYNQPFWRAVRYASMRLPTPSLPIASDR
jgi:hypothetical protein